MDGLEQELVVVYAVLRRLLQAQETRRSADRLESLTPGPGKTGAGGLRQSNRSRLTSAKDLGQLAQANSHGQKVQSAGNNMASTDSAVGSSWA